MTKALVRCLTALLLVSPVAAELRATGEEPAPDIPTLQEKALEAYESKDYAAAATYFALVAEAGVDAASNYYNAACGHSLSGQIDEAFQMLELALQAGYTNYSNMSGDSDLQNLRGDARFERLLDRIDDNKIVITENLQHTADKAEFVFEDAHNFIRAMKLVDAGGPRTHAGEGVLRQGLGGAQTDGHQVPVHRGGTGPGDREVPGKIRAHCQERGNAEGQRAGVS